VPIKNGMSAPIHPKQVFPCALCQRTDFRTVAYAGLYNTSTTVKACRGCGLVCLNPRWDEAGYTAYYQSNYYDSYHAGSDLTPKVDERGRTIASCVSRDADVLEIGAGFGANILALSQLARRLVAVEIDPKATAVIKQHTPRCEVVTASLEEYARGAAGEKFDVVVLSHVLEHFVEPRNALTTVKRLVKPTGCLLVLVPNLDRHRGFLTQFTTPHTHYFSDVTLRAMLESVGFTCAGRNGHPAELFFIAVPSNDPGPGTSAGEYERVQKMFRRAWLTGWPNQLGRQCLQAVMGEGTARKAQSAARAVARWRPWRS
jgi:SAM-dependent methyltransferase